MYIGNVYNILSHTVLMAYHCAALRHMYKEDPVLMYIILVIMVTDNVPTLIGGRAYKYTLMIRSLCISFKLTMYLVTVQ